MERIAAALERIAPPPAQLPDFSLAEAWVWGVDPDRLEPVAQVSRVGLELLVGIDRARDTLLANTRRFAEGLPANNALLWGARGMGKSSLVKAAHAAANAETGRLHLVEIHREDVPSIGRLLSLLASAGRGPAHPPEIGAQPDRQGGPQASAHAGDSVDESAGGGLRFLVFCDDLSFDQGDSHYKSLKAVLDGGVAGRPETVLFYATSNRRHLMPRDMIENERSTAINPSEATEEKVSLSDRFGLWLGFHPCDQEQFLTMIRGYCAALALDVPEERLQAEAIEWRQTRGAMSGRVAWQFVQDLAGRERLHG
ncbi:MAG: ATP-binding protein [Pseudomonadota bacterium]